MSFATLPDSGCEYTLFKLNRLFGPIVHLQSVIPVILMTYKMQNMCCSDVPIPRSALSVRSMPHFLNTTSREGFSFLHLHVSHRMPCLGSCEFWVQEIDLVKHNPKPPHNQTPADTATHTPPSTAPPTLILPEIYRSRVACIYNTEGKYVGMITPDRFDILYRAFHKAKALGLHSSICPPPARQQGLHLN
eukprot:1156096-Pelagomonas_calceolata.AAC.1